MALQTLSTGGTSTNFIGSTYTHEGGFLNYATHGTFGSATMELQVLPPGSTAGSTQYISAGSEAAHTAKAVCGVQLNAGCKYRIQQSGSTGNAAIRAYLW